MESIKAYVPSSAVSKHTDSYQDITNALRGYSADIETTDLKRMRNSLESLSDDDREWLAQVYAKLGIEQDLPSRGQEAVAANQRFLLEVESRMAATTEEGHYSFSGSAAARVRLLPWAIAREWGTEFASERDLVYQPILAELTKRFPTGKAKVLVPGAGCCRLAYDLACAGFGVTAVEFDSLKVSATLHVLSLGLKGEQIELYPFVLETCNRMNHSDNTRPVAVPAISIDAESLRRLSINGNEFLEYASGVTDGEFDSVVTTFFLDTSTDIDAYAREIARVLKPGGVWINCGSLNYHYACEKSVPRTPTRELNAEETLAVVKRHGFTVTHTNQVETTYMGNHASMMQTKYRCVFFVARLG